MKDLFGEEREEGKPDEAATCAACGQPCDSRSGYALPIVEGRLVPRGEKVLPPAYDPAVCLGCWGAYSFDGAHGLATWLRHLRSAGVPTPVDPEALER